MRSAEAGQRLASVENEPSALALKIIAVGVFSFSFPRSRHKMSRVFANGFRNGKRPASVVSTVPPRP